MPKIVDHDARRAELVTTYLRLVAEHGIEAVNSRTVSAALGVSAGSLWNYFPSVDHLVAAAAARVLQRDAREATGEGARGVAALRALLERLLPLDDRSRSESGLVVAFWGSRRARDAVGGDLVGEDPFVEAFDRALREAVEDGDLRPGTPTRDLAAALNQLVDGAQVEQVLHPGLSADDHRARVAAVLGGWSARGDAVSAAVRGPSTR